jgi:hypothetical protein
MSRTLVPLLLALAIVLPFTSTAAPRPAHSEPPPRAERPGKPTGPIAVEHKLAAPPAVGVPVAATITARVEPGAGELVLEVSASQPGAVLLTAPVLVASGPGLRTWQVTVVPLTVDAGYLNALVTAEIDGIPQARTVAIALRSAAPAEPAAEPSAEGETLIALPVEEGP